MGKFLLTLFVGCLVIFQSGCSKYKDTVNVTNSEKDKKVTIAATHEDSTNDGNTHDSSEDDTATAAQEATSEADNPHDAAPWPTKEWSTSTPEEQGLDSAQLEKANQRINDNYPNIYSLLVIRHGYLVYEKYYQGMDVNSYNPVYSVTKSVMSALTGIALNENILENIDQKVSDLIPDYFTSVEDQKKKEISLKNVLTMTGGLETIDSDYDSYFSSPDWLAYALSKPVSDDLGKVFVYNTGLTHFLSGILTEESNMSTKEFAENYLFDSLNIHIKRWDSDFAGHYGGGAGLYLTPREMAKFGYLYLNKGKWEEKQIIPEEWVAASTSKQINVGPGLDYGYLFWIQDMTDKATDTTYHTYRADGAGGQKIIVIPELDMVVVVTADLYTSALDKTDDQQMVEDYVLPAVTE